MMFCVWGVCVCVSGGWCPILPAIALSISGSPLFAPTLCNFPWNFAAQILTQDNSKAFARSFCENTNQKLSPAWSAASWATR